MITTPFALPCLIALLATMPERPPVPGAPPEALPSPEPAPLRERPSKTRRKQASHELQSLGEALLELPDDQVAALGLSESLVDAIRAAHRIRAHEARRRQMQLIGKLMRANDVELARAAVAERQLGRARDSLALHQAERWRAELIADDDATTRFAREHPGADVQQLRTLVRNARKDQSLVVEQRSGRAFRELFQFIRASEHDG
jgi:ribosome-associated protein